MKITQKPRPKLTKIAPPSMPVATVVQPSTMTALDVFGGTAKVESSPQQRHVSLPVLQQRRLPELMAALTDVAVTALPPSSIAVPDDVMAALHKAKRILVIGHVPPDGDCVGSAGGLVAALKAAGKDAVAVVDDDLPASSRAIAHGQVMRAAEAEGTFDLVVLVDVAAAARVGGAARFLAAADHVLVIDHHEGGPTPESLGLKPRSTLTAWNDPGADAAAVLVAGIAARLTPHGEAWAASSAALASAMYTDTLGFRAPGAQLDTLRLFKGVVGDVAGLRHLQGELHPPLHPAVAAVLDAVDASVHGDHGARIVVSAAVWRRALDVAAAVDPAIVPQDLRGHLCDRLDLLRDRHGLAALLIEEATGVRISLRSVADGVAHDVALALGGGGHGRAAAAVQQGSVDDVVALLRKAIKETLLAREAMVRSGRLLD